MIQRIQTVFLALAAVLNLIVYFTPIYSRAIEDPQAWIGYGLAISLAVALLLSVYSIFLFSDRKNQLSWVKRALISEIIVLAFSVGVLFSLGGIGSYLWDELLGTTVVIASILVQMLALKYINKDEKLVKSMDRIR